MYLYLETIGEVYLDDVKIVAGDEPDVGANLVANGDFESAFPGPYVLANNVLNSTLSTTVHHSGSAGLRLVTTTGGTTQSSAISQTLPTGLTVGANYTLSYWYLPNTAGGTLTIRLSGSGIKSTIDIKPDPASVARFTPGTSNNVATLLPAFPSIWINEVLPANTDGITDAQGQHEPWIELVSAASQPLDISGWSLSDSYASLAKWTFPAGTILQPGAFKVVFADGNGADSTDTELHTGFRINPTAGSVVLSRQQLGSPAVVDFVDYSGMAADVSVVSLPDGQLHLRQNSTLPTPGSGNRIAAVAAPNPSATVDSNGLITLSWPSAVGANYRVEFLNQLGGQWQILTQVKATGPTSSVTDASSGRTERYYRLVVP